MKLVWVSILVTVAFLGGCFYDAWEQNCKAMNFVKGAPIVVSDSDCAQIWLAAAQATQNGDLTKQRFILKHALDCSPYHISLVQIISPYDKKLAFYATQLYPSNPAAWFWFAKTQMNDSPQQAIKSYWQGLQWDPHNARVWIELGRVFASLQPETALNLYEDLDIEQLGTDSYFLQVEMQFVLATILSDSDPNRAIQLFRQGLHHMPGDGVRWSYLAYLLSETDPQAAFEAFLRSCNLDDPGAHGCYGAGRMMEQLGDPQRAIEYYRRSHFEKALARADELEARLSGK